MLAALATKVIALYFQNDTVAVKQSVLRHQKALAAEEDRRRMRLLNALSRGHKTSSDDSESFCKFNGPYSYCHG